MPEEGGRVAALRNHRLINYKYYYYDYFMYETLECWNVQWRAAIVSREPKRTYLEQRNRNGLVRRTSWQGMQVIIILSRRWCADAKRGIGADLTCVRDVAVASPLATARDWFRRWSRVSRGGSAAGMTRRHDVRLRPATGERAAGGHTEGFVSERGVRGIGSEKGTHTSMWYFYNIMWWL